MASDTSDIESDDSYGLQESREVCRDLNFNEEKISEPSADEKHRKRLQWKRLVFAVFFVICLIGCIYQMADLLRLYLQYNIDSDITFEKSTLVVPPSMSICFPYITLIKLPLLFDMFPETKLVAERIRDKTGENVNFTNHRIRYVYPLHFAIGGFDWEFGKYIETHLSIGEILLATVTLDEMFEQCVLVLPENYIPHESKKLSACKKGWDLDYYIKNECKCFLFAYKNYVYDFFKISNNYAYRNLLYQVRLNWMKGLSDLMEFVIVTFHPRGKLPRGTNDPPLKLNNPSKNVTYTISFGKQKSQLLEAPYSSNCKDYSKIGFESRAECIEKCVIEKSLPVHHRVPYNMVFDKESTLTTISAKEMWDNLTLRAQVLQIFEDCRHVCRNKNCIHEVYLPHLSATEDGNLLKFLVEIPSNPDLLTDIDPDMSFIEFVIKNTSVLSFWFGFCVLQIADVIEYLKEKRRRAQQLAKMIIARKARLRLQNGRI